MTTKSDEKIVREALKHYLRLEGPTVKMTPSEFALDALDRLMSRSVPELPEGWIIRMLHQYHYAGTIVTEHYGVHLCMPRHSAEDFREHWVAGEGDSIREAITNAIKKIGGQT